MRVIRGLLAGEAVYVPLPFESMCRRPKAWSGCVNGYRVEGPHSQYRLTHRMSELATDPARDVY